MTASYRSDPARQADGDRPGPTAILQAHYPAAYRLAAGLCGRADDAAAVARRVLDRAVVLVGRWESDEAAGRWFLRFTVLTARDRCPPRTVADAGTVASLSWLQPVPSQQREVILLVYGLELDLHRAAAAMDCSTEAAANHLVRALAAVRAAGTTDASLAGLPAALAAIVPPPQCLSDQVVRTFARRRRWWLLWRLARAAALAGVAAGLGWAAWYVGRRLVF